MEWSFHALVLGVAWHQYVKKTEKKKLEQYKICCLGNTIIEEIKWHVSIIPLCCLGNRLYMKFRVSHMYKNVLIFLPVTMVMAPKNVQNFPPFLELNIHI